MRRTVTLLLLGLLLLPAATLAQSSDTGLLPACTVDGNCQFEDFLQGFVNIANWGLSILGLIGVTMFVTGGLYLMLSAGRSSMVAKGKAILAGATTGILIVLFAWVGIGTVYVSVTGDSQGTIFAGIAGVTPFSFLKKSTGGTDEEPPTATACSPTASPGIQIGCTEAPSLTRGPIHVTNILLNSKPSCWIGGPVRSTYDEAMAASVRNFQKANGIAITGSVDPTTWDLLWQDNATCVPPTVPDELGQPVAVARGGCCLLTDIATAWDTYPYGSCTPGYIDAQTGQGFSSGLCGAGYTYSNKACDDIAGSANLLTCMGPPSGNGLWGTCDYLFTAPYGPSPRTMKTGKTTCCALGSSSLGPCP